MSVDGAALLRFTAPLMCAVVLSAADAGRPASYPELLARYVRDDGSVDYARWRQSPPDVAALDQALVALQRAPPSDRAAANEQLAGWLNLYNALVIREIVRHWPVASVKDIVALDGGFTDGGTFFSGTTFQVGKKRMSLDQIEDEVIRATYKDARIHFAINCGARSCPVLKPEAFTGPRLVEQLEVAARGYINDPQHVAVKDGDRAVVLSQLFDWYRDDFAAFARGKGESADVLGFLLLYAEPELAAGLRRARAGNYRLAFVDYDWKVNDAPALDGGGIGATRWTLLDGGTWSAGDDRGKVIVIDFWATWCAPCRASFPRLQQLHRENRDAGLVVIGVAEERRSRAVADFLKQTGATFPNVIDEQQLAQKAPWNVEALPTELLIDRKGVVRYRHEGLPDGGLDMLAREVQLLLREKP